MADGLGQDGAAATDERYSRLRPTLIGVVVMAGTMAFIAWEFHGIVAAPLLLGWTGYMLAIDAGLLAWVFLVALPTARFHRPSSRWAQAGNIFSIGFSLGVVIGVWILLPPADPALRMLAVLLFVWFIAMMMMSSGTLVNMIGCLALLTSLLAFIVTSDMAYRWQLALFLVSVGAALVGIRRLIWRAADEAAAARALSERAATALDAALALAQAQRDGKTRFIAAASHDLQQPLQAARLFLDRLAATPDGPARERALAGAQAALGSSQGMIEAMLDFLRLDADAEVARLRPVALDPLLAALVAEHAPGAAERGVRLAAWGGGLIVTADPAMLRRALGNLLGNALRHAGGTRVTLLGRRHGGVARLWVVDDGRGVDVADRATLFDDFSQGKGTDPAPGGFGLGLASARRLAAAMGGRAGLDPRWAGGAAFFLDLPMAAAPAAATAGEPACAAA